MSVVKSLYDETVIATRNKFIKSRFAIDGKNSIFNKLFICFLLYLTLNISYLLLSTSHLLLNVCNLLHEVMFAIIIYNVV